MRKVDPRWNKIWLFFMIIAAGLALSWGQIGKKYSKTYPDELPRLLLRTEKACELQIAPCAAYAPDYALVARLLNNQGWKTLMLRASGEALSTATRIKLSFVPSTADVDLIPLPLRFREPDIWYSDLQLPQDGKIVWKLRVEVQQSDRVLVAEYPLPEQPAIQ